jgi:hypothetical protein
MCSTRSAWTALAVLVLITICGGAARAQPLGPRVGAPTPGPTVSPYINLLRTGNSAASNYYGLVRPQLQTNAGLQTLQQQIYSGQSQPLPGSEPTSDLLITGHSAVFMNYGGFFQSATGGLSTRGPVTSQVGQAPAPGSRLPAVRR